MVAGASILFSVPLAFGQRGGQSTSRPEPPAPQRAELAGDNPIIVATDLVTAIVTVTDREGRHVSGLDRNAFTVLDEGVPQQISFFSDADTPLSVGVIFDTSGSMSNKKITRAREALARFIQVSHPLDEYFLIGFSSQAQLLVDRTRDADALLSRLTYVEPHGQTALYDAVYLGAEKVSHGVHSKRVLLVISDGEENESRYSFGELRRALQESDVIIYAVGILGRYPIKTPGIAGRDTLKKLAGLTGGQAFFPENASEMSEAFERIALELRHQYAIGYRPSNFVRDGRWRALKITIKQPYSENRLVRSRKGYYAVGK